MPADAKLLWAEGLETKHGVWSESEIDVLAGRMERKRHSPRPIRQETQACLVQDIVDVTSYCRQTTELSSFQDSRLPDCGILTLRDTAQLTVGTQ